MPRGGGLTAAGLLPATRSRSHDLSQEGAAQVITSSLLAAALSDYRFVDLIAEGHNKLSSALWLNSLIIAFKKCVLRGGTGQLDLKEEQRTLWIPNARAAALNN